MATPQEVKSNIYKLVQAGAPESDVDAYVQSEGFTADQLRSLSSDESGGMLMPTQSQLSERDKRASAEKDNQIGINDIISPVLGLRKMLMNTGNVPLSVRAKESLKVTPEGKANYLRSVYPSMQAPLSPLAGTSEGQRVQGVANENGRISIYDQGVGQYVPFNKPGSDLGDIAGMAGTALSTSPNLAAGLLGPAGLNPLVQGAAGMTGEALHQGASSLLPGDDNLSSIDRAKIIGTRGAQDTILSGVMKYGAKAFDALRPHNIFFSKPYQKVINSEVAVQGREAATGQPSLTLADETRSPHFLSLQKTAMQSETGKSMVEDYWRNQTKATLSKLDESFNMAKSSPFLTEDTAKAIQNGLKRTTTAIYKGRTASWDNAMDKAIAVSKGQPIIDSTAWEATRGKIGEMIALNPALGGSMPVAAADSMKALKMLDQPMSALQLKELLKSNIPNSVRRTLLSDVEKYSATATADNQAALGFVGQARQGWSEYTQQLTDLKANTISAFLKSDKQFAANLAEVKPEMVVDKMNRLSPTEFRTAVSSIGAHFPEDLQTIKQAFLQKAKDEAITAAKGSSPEKIQFSLGKFVRNTLDDRKYNILFSSQERQAIKDAKDVFNRLRLSQSASGDTMADAQRVAEGVSTLGGAVTGQQQSIAIFGPKFLTKWLSGPYLAKRMFDPKAQQALRLLKSTKPGTKTFNNAAAILVGDTISQPSEISVANQLPLSGQPDGN